MILEKCLKRLFRRRKAKSIAPPDSPTPTPPQPTPSPTPSQTIPQPNPPHLPNEITLHIFSYTDELTLWLSCRQVSQTFLDLAQDTLFQTLLPRLELTAVFRFEPRADTPDDSAMYLPMFPQFQHMSTLRPEYAIYRVAALSPGHELYPRTMVTRDSGFITGVLLNDPREPGFLYWIGTRRTEAETCPDRWGWPATMSVVWKPLVIEYCRALKQGRIQAARVAEQHVL